MVRSAAAVVNTRPTAACYRYTLIHARKPISSVDRVWKGCGHNWSDMGGCSTRLRTVSREA